MQYKRSYRGPGTLGGSVKMQDLIYTDTSESIETVSLIILFLLYTEDIWIWDQKVEYAMIDLNVTFHFLIFTCVKQFRTDTFCLNGPIFQVSKML